MTRPFTFTYLQEMYNEAIMKVCKLIISAFVLLQKWPPFRCGVDNC
jgi:hypothetical protein